MIPKDYDLLIIGGGPGGYTSAIRAAQKGLKTALLERHLIGGTCLNKGCVPTKALLEDSLMISAVRHSPFLKGELKISLNAILERKHLLVERARAGIAGVLKDNGVNIFTGEASFADPRTLLVNAESGSVELIRGSKIIIATGAQAEYSPGFVVDGDQVWNTDHALAFKTIPRSIAIIGAGNRGVEFASIFHNLGSKVFLVEKQKRILPREHRWLSNRYQKILRERQIHLFTSTMAMDLERVNSNEVKLILESVKGLEAVRVNRVLLTGTRRPTFEGLNIETAGLSLEQGTIPFGAGMETKVRGIYVVGDAAGPPYLAHKAIKQAIIAVSHVLGLDASGSLPVIPNCIYGNPEIASVGLTEYGARKAGHEVRTGESRVTFLGEYLAPVSYG